MARQEQKKDLNWAVLIFSNIFSPRFNYIVDFLSDYFKTNIDITTNVEEFSNYKDVRINYSENKIIENEIWIRPAPLLQQHGILNIEVDCFLHANNFKALFKTAGSIEFDMFSAIFYLLSRYEEYLPFQEDEYGRFAHQNSIAFKEGFLHQPLINTWLEYFRRELKKQFPNALLAEKKFQFIPSYDIDIAWSFKNKGFLRNVGGFARSIIQRDWKSAKQRVNVLLDKAKDPFDSYEWMDEMHKKWSLKPIYFFHVGQLRNKYDKNISIKNTQFKNLIKENATKYDIGLHPSWHSGDDHIYFIKEKDFLSGLIKKEIQLSRQHYIRFSFPDTFRNLIAAGITDDYSMGYGTINGFRASITTSFFWYDLEKEEKSNLLIHPFCFMDANSFYEQKFSTGQTLEELISFYKVVKEVNGTLITVWHNQFLGTGNLYQGWRDVYFKFLNKVCN